MQGVVKSYDPGTGTGVLVRDTDRSEVEPGPSVDVGPRVEPRPSVEPSRQVLGQARRRRSEAP